MFLPSKSELHWTLSSTVQYHLSYNAQTSRSTMFKTLTKNLVWARNRKSPSNNIIVERIWSKQSDGSALNAEAAIDYVMYRSEHIRDWGESDLHDLVRRQTSITLQRHPCSVFERGTSCSLDRRRWKRVLIFDLDRHVICHHYAIGKWTVECLSRIHPWYNSKAGPGYLWSIPACTS